MITAIFGGAVTILTSLIGAYATANGTLYQVKQDVAVVEERENNHYLEVNKTLERIEKKLDTIGSSALTAAAKASTERVRVQALDALEASTQ